MVKDSLKFGIFSHTLVMIARGKNSPFKIEPNREKRTPYYHAFEYLTDNNLIKKVSDKSGYSQHNVEYEIDTEGNIKYIERNFLANIKLSEIGVNAKFDHNFREKTIELFLEDYLSNTKFYNNGLRSLFLGFMSYIVSMAHDKKIALKYSKSGLLKEIPVLEKVLKGQEEYDDPSISKEGRLSYDNEFLLKCAIYFGKKASQLLLS